MDPAQFLTSPRVTIVAGKGGVGKTTVSAALGLAASHSGLRALIIQVDPMSGLPGLFGRKSLGYEDIELEAPDAENGWGGLRARTIAPDDALAEYLKDHGLQRISKRLAASGALDMVATATPGIKDVLVLGKIKQIERSGLADAIIVDGHAAGHAITFLKSAAGLLDAVRVGPIETQAREVQDLLTDPSRCQVVLVTLPEETPVNELVETAFSLEDDIGVMLGPVVVNGLYPVLDGLAVDPEAAAADAGASLRPGEADAMRAAAAFRTNRTDLQVAQVKRLAHRLPLPQLRLPFRFNSSFTRDDIAVLADTLIEAIASLTITQAGGVT